MTANHLSEINPAEFKLQKLLKSKDTINGYYFKFTDNTPFKLVVKTIDLSAKNKLDYLLDYNQLWTFHIQTKKVKGEKPFCSTNLKY